MLTEAYLNLHPVHLKAHEKWAREDKGICFLFPVSGAGKFVNGGATQSLSAGDVIVVNGEPSAKISTANGGDFAFVSFSVQLDHLFPLFASAEIALLQDLIEQIRNHRFYPASTSLAMECHRLIADVSPQFNLDHRAQLLRLAAAILNEEFRSANNRRGNFLSSQEHLVQVFGRLSSDEIISVSIKDLAASFGCSRRHLNRLFHQYLGFSVGGLRMEMRLLKAVSLLRDPTAKIINVAEQCGFNHLGLFNTCFKKRFGTSPGLWRKVASESAKASMDHNGDEDPDCPLRVKGLCPWPVNRMNTELTPCPKATGARRTIPQGRSRKPSRPQTRPWPVAKITVASAQKPIQSITFQVRAQP